ncbi:MAG: hypothetical protein QW140_01545 [Candidatus Aenigmatarchaeota archaeon]
MEKRHPNHLTSLSVSLWLAFLFFVSSMGYFALIKERTDYALLVGLIGIGSVLGVISFELALIAYNLEKLRK